MSLQAKNQNITPPDKLQNFQTHLAGFFPPGRRSLLFAVCAAMLILWCVWLAFSFYKQDLLGGKYLWFPPSWGCDFYRHIDHPARIWWNGGDPYTKNEIFFAFPPLQMRLFAWVNLVTPRAANMAWLLVMAVIIAAATWMTSRWRRRLSLSEIPPIAAIVLILFSTPVLFAMERGQYDPLCLLFILAALPLLRHPSHWAQYLAGAVLCLAPWIKAYPGLLFVGLIGLRRFRALTGFAITGIAFALFFFQSGEIQKFLVNNARHIQEADNLALWVHGAIHPSSHPFSAALAGIWLGTKFHGFGLLPGKILAVVILLLLLAWVTFHIYRSPAREALTYPYLLWIVALATFVPPVSNDYNFVFLPLAVLAVCDRHDPWPPQIALALLLLWWQPINLSVNGTVLFVIKLLALVATAACLVRRTGEQSRKIEVESLLKIAR